MYLVGFYYTNISRCGVLRMSNAIHVSLQANIGISQTNQCCAWLQASAPVLIRSSFCWDVKQRRFVVIYWRFRRTFFKGLNLEDRTDRLSRNSVPANLRYVIFQKRETQKSIPFDIFPTRCKITQFIYFWKTALHVSGGFNSKIQLTCTSYASAQDCRLQEFLHRSVIWYGRCKFKREPTASGPAKTVQYNSHTTLKPVPTLPQ